jgi:hypothetical protein
MKQHDLSGQWQIFVQTMTGKESWKLLLAFILVFANWGVEAIKWKQILAPLQKLSLFDSFNAILAGVAFALNTPNRIGEYAARVLYVEEGKRGKAISLCLVSSLSQLSVTFLSGFIALLVLHQKLMGTFILFKVFSFGIFTLVSILLTFFLLIIYFKISWLINMLERFTVLKKLSEFFREVKELTLPSLWKIFTLSVCRYAIFIAQYILLLQVMHVNIPFWESIGVIAILFLCLAMIPTIALLELGIRWELGLMLFGIYSHNVLGIYMVASVIWLFNLLIPAIFGSLSILRIRIFKVAE